MLISAKQIVKIVKRYFQNQLHEIGPRTKTIAFADQKHQYLSAVCLTARPQHTTRHLQNCKNSPTCKKKLVQGSVTNSLKHTNKKIHK